MKAVKKRTYELEKCYSIGALHYQNKEHLVVAAEKVNKCLLFDLEGNLEETIWDGPGGTMSIVQVPGTDGQFLATQLFYSPNDSAAAKIVWVVPKGKNDWEVKTLAEVPFVHRFDIVSRNGVNYLIACALKSGHQQKDDWSSPGKILVGELPEDLSLITEENPLELTVLKEGLLKNHGYCRVETEEGMWSAVAADTGIYQVTPPEVRGGAWTVDLMVNDPASDMTFADLDGDGELEMLVMAPFHGDEIKIYKKQNGQYVCVWTFEQKYEFLHGIWGCEVNGRGVVFVGHRKAERDLYACTCENGRYELEKLDSDVGPANLYFYKNGSKNCLVSTNREIDEIAFYEIENFS